MIIPPGNSQIHYSVHNLRLCKDINVLVFLLVKNKHTKNKTKKEFMLSSFLSSLET